MSESEVTVPLPVRLRFGHAAVQQVANTAGLDVLHIKGVAVDPELRPTGYAGSDVDVLVRPAHVAAIDRALRAGGWTLYSTFEHGSPFGHAQTYLHESWGYLDIHRYFPGIRLEPERAFELLWEDLHRIELAGTSCRVPSPAAQAVILVLNAARSAKGDRADVLTVWSDADDERREEITELVGRLHAEVAFAAAAGGLERFRDDREYPLWKVVSEGGSRAAEWWARIRAAPSARDRLRLVARAPRVNVEHLAHRLGRTPSRWDIAVEFLRRPLSGVGEGVRSLYRRFGPRRVVR
ncbi:nucleotidyltransferase family protein [Agromyces kandeliae]|uniref:2-nitropropane dioxygenase n=1 Tax=Agromyces kandeliae TaxID=2666141 RepID=A0A6L5R129_9MICO|nr:nucleotidyltransferase family protein [Agromyces kandeliae]MRX43690.1 2-nitropropane dioxygenase [Agromyces kandeliae]